MGFQALETQHTSRPKDHSASILIAGNAIVRLLEPGNRLEAGHPDPDRDHRESHMADIGVHLAELRAEEIQRNREREARTPSVPSILDVGCWT